MRYATRICHSTYLLYIAHLIRPFEMSSLPMTRRYIRVLSSNRQSSGSMHHRHVLTDCWLKRVDQAPKPKHSASARQQNFLHNAPLCICSAVDEGTRIKSCVQLFRSSAPDTHAASIRRSDSRSVLLRSRLRQHCFHWYP